MIKKLDKTKYNITIGTFLYKSRRNENDQAPLD